MITKQMKIGDFFLNIPEIVYTPGEDSFFFEDCLKKEIINHNFPISICYDLGCGSGYLSLVLRKHLSNAKIYASDISEKALTATKNNLSLNNFSENIILLESDLLKEVIKIYKDNSSNKIDLLVFNPPYLPGEILNSQIHERALIGGNKTGDTIILNFFDQISRNKYLLFSQTFRIMVLLSNWNKIAEQWLKSEEYFKIVRCYKKNLPGESLKIYVLRNL